MTVPKPKDDLFERALKHGDIEQISGEKLKQGGAHMRGACPLCKASENRKDGGGAFAYSETTGRWKCFSCTAKWSDIIDLEHRLRSVGGETIRDAAMRIVNDMAGSKSERKTNAVDRAKADEDLARKKRWRAALAVRTWGEAVSARGSLVETYLRSRNIYGKPLEDALDQVRFHPSAYHSGPSKNPVLAPAMILLRMAPGGPTGGIHNTYLLPDGSGKTALPDQRKMFGPQSRIGSDGVDRPGGLWLTRPDAVGSLIVGEGAETVLSAACEMGGGPFRSVATGSLDALQGGWATDASGALNLADFEPCPHRTAFTWPDPPQNPWGIPYIALDRDMGAMRAHLIGADGIMAPGSISPEARAMLCGVLASHAWIKSGAPAVIPIMPLKEGWDFNNQLEARVAGELIEKGVIKLGVMTEATLQGA